MTHVEPATIAKLPADLKNRVNFEVHDFLQPQTIAPPTAFLLRWILHDWPDAYCVRILKGLVPAMRERTKLLIYENVMSDEPVRDLSGRMNTKIDVAVGACLNGKERRRAEHQRLLARSDRRFGLEAVRKREGSTMSVLEVTWKP